jgi:hypothetical protein
MNTMTDIEKARLLKAREIAADIWIKLNNLPTADDSMKGVHDNMPVMSGILAALNLCDWQPPEDPDERAAYEIYAQEQNGDPLYKWEQRRRSAIWCAALAAYKAGKAAR